MAFSSVVLKIRYLINLVKCSGFTVHNFKSTSTEVSSPLAIGHPSSDGVTIKMLYGVDVLHDVLLLYQLRLA